MNGGGVISRSADLAGQRFGRLTVVGRSATIGKNVRWLCRCDCGSEHVVYGQNLRNGSVKSCGCQAHPQTHGMTGSRIYQTWASMHARCNSPSYWARKHYADKGITICEDWKRFEAFRDWAMQNGYTDNLTLDRKDNSKGYEASNCRFISIADQQRNKSNHTFLSYNGKTQALYQWASELGLKKSTICTRIARGWTVERALSQPIRRF